MPIMCALNKQIFDHVIYSAVPEGTTQKTQAPNSKQPATDKIVPADCQVDK